MNNARETEGMGSQDLQDFLDIPEHMLEVQAEAFIPAFFGK